MRAACIAKKFKRWKSRVLAPSEKIWVSSVWSIYSIYRYNYNKRSPGIGLEQWWQTHWVLLAMGVMPLFFMYSVSCWGTSANTALASISGGAWIEGGQWHSITIGSDHACLYLTCANSLKGTNCTISRSATSEPTWSLGVRERDKIEVHSCKEHNLHDHCTSVHLNPAHSWQQS